MFLGTDPIHGSAPAAPGHNAEELFAKVKAMAQQRYQRCLRCSDFEDQSICRHDRKKLAL